MAHKLGKKLLSWDESIDDEVRYRLDQHEEDLKVGVISKDERKTEKEIEGKIYADQDFWHFHWEDFTAYLTSILDRKSPDGYWKAQVRNFGWRNLDGVKFLQAKSGASFLREILPQTDCHFYIFNYGKGLAIQNFHHDSPVGKAGGCREVNRSLRRGERPGRDPASAYANHYEHGQVEGRISRKHERHSRTQGRATLRRFLNAKNLWDLIYPTRSSGTSI